MRKETKVSVIQENKQIVDSWAEIFLEQSTLLHFEKNVQLHREVYKIVIWVLECESIIISNKHILITIMAVKEDTEDMINPPEGFDARTLLTIQLSSPGIPSEPVTS